MCVLWSLWLEVEDIVKKYDYKPEDGGLRLIDCHMTMMCCKWFKHHLGYQVVVFYLVPFGELDEDDDETDDEFEVDEDEKVEVC